MSEDFRIPPTNVLAIASHVVYGYVGNTMATFAMQSLGAEVAALNTVQYSNHLGYGQATGRKTTAEEVSDLYRGLEEAYVDEFDMMLSGYIPGAEAVAAVGTIARQLRKKAAASPGSFFWVLDPVMGDNGKLYVAADVVPAYKSIIKDADLILPNQFEAETLSGVSITDIASLRQAITALHQTFKIPHIIVTSVKLPSSASEDSLTVFGSTCTSSSEPRIFQIEVPSIDCFFSGTGDMFAALMVVRLKETVCKVDGLVKTTSWISGDGVDATSLPLAKATEKVLASMHGILKRTKVERDQAMEKFHTQSGGGPVDPVKSRLAQSKAAEVRLVRNVDLLRKPNVTYQASKLD